MATTVNLKKLLHRPQWEPCSPIPVANAAAMMAKALKIDSYNINCGIVATSATVFYCYDSIVDAYVQLPSPGTAFSGTFGAGASCKIHPVSVGRTATAGTTSTITTNLTIVRDLRNYKIRITGGPSALGQELTIISNTIGANSVITVATQGVAFSNATTYQLITPSLYMVNAGTTGANIFQRYDWALNTWSVLSNTNLVSMGTDAQMVVTPGILGGAFASNADYTFSAAGASTLTVTGSSWTTNQWTNYQIRITGGTGAGQIRTIASNTGTQLTVGSAWGTQPDGTSTWVIEGNDDFIYLLGNNAVTMYRYSISGNAWTVMAPTVARGAAPGAGMSASWVFGATASDWTNKNVIKNGRYIYSFRGAGGAILDIFDIAGGTAGAGAWAAQSYGNAAETFTTGATYEYDGRNNIFVAQGTGRMLRLDVVANGLEPLSLMPYPQGTATLGDKLFVYSYIDGGTRIDFLYFWRNTGTEVFRTITSYLLY